MTKFAIIGVLSIAVLCCLTLPVCAQDPATSWMSYVIWTAPAKITTMNMTWVVPSLPKDKFGSNAPGWWFGIEPLSMTTLLQPILAWADGAPEYTIFNGEYTWSNGVFTQSKSGVVQPGDTVFGSIVYQESTDTYAMTISCQQTGFSVTTVKPASGLEFVNAEIVFEHQPDSCSAFPTSNTCTFSNIYIEANYEPVTPVWQAKQEKPACSSQAHVNSPSSVTITWQS